MRRTIAKVPIITALNLLFFAVYRHGHAGITLPADTRSDHKSEEAEKLKLITQIAPRESYDNDIIKDTGHFPPMHCWATTMPASPTSPAERPSPVAVLQVHLTGRLQRAIDLIIWRCVPTEKSVGCAW